MAKILIVEDNASVAELLGFQLKSAGFEFFIAPDAMIGVQKCVSWRPDLVLLDLMLPAGGGLAVLRNMKNSIYTRDIPVIVLTGSTDLAMKKQLLEFNVRTLIQKPHDPHDLMLNIKSALNPVNHGPNPDRR